MNYQPATINIPKLAIKEREGVVVLSLKKWQKIEEDLEDLEMYRSRRLAEEISDRRKDKKTISLASLIEKYKI